MIYYQNVTWNNKCKILRGPTHLWKNRLFLSLTSEGAFGIITYEFGRSHIGIGIPNQQSDWLNQQMPKINKKNYFIFYTLIFIVLFFLCIGIYLTLHHKSALRERDTYDMQYHEFLYFGRWIREAVSTRHIPVWESSIGYGGDVFLTMSKFIMDPVHWIAIITPMQLAEYVFALTIIFRIYLCGLSFSYVCFKRGLEPYAVLCGAVIYIFGACT